MKVSFHGAGQAELLSWHNKTGQQRTAFLVHGEEESMQALLKNSLKLQSKCQRYTRASNWPDR